MTRDEVLLLGRWVQAACPQQKWDKYTPDVWTEMLGAYPAEDAMLAAKALVQRQPFIALAELITEIKVIRKARIQAVGPEVLGAGVDADDVGAYLEKVRSDVKAIGDGTAEPDYESGELRPVAALLESSGIARRAIGGSR